MKTSLSQGVSKRHNGNSNTGAVTYNNKTIDSSATKIIGDTYAFCSDGYKVYVEPIPQNGMEHFRIWIGDLTDNLESPVKFKVCLIGHPVLVSLNLLALYLNTEVSVLKCNAIAYANSKRVAKVVQQRAPKITGSDRYQHRQINRHKSREQSRLMKGVWLG